MTDPSHHPSSSPDGVPPWLRRAALTVALVLLGVLATLWVADRLRTLIFILFISLFISFALEPAVLFLTKRGWGRRLATAGVFVLAAVLAVGFVASLVPLFVSQAAELTRNLPAHMQGIQEWLAEREVEVELVDPQIAGEFRSVGAFLGRYASRAAGGIFAVGNTIFSAIFQVVTIALFSYYMVAEGPTLRRTVLSFMPPARQRETLRIWEIAVEKTGGYIYSRTILAVVAALFTAGVLTLLGVPYPLALGLWVGVLSQFLPVIGTYLAAILPVLVALAQEPIDALWVAVALVGYQQAENYLIAPRITARTMSLHPAVSVGALIAGVSLMGGIGAVLALPAAATIQAVISTALERHEVVDSDIEVASWGGRRPRAEEPSAEPGAGEETEPASG